MKVILLQDIPKTGKKGDVVEVSQGHANNFLIPQKKARPATNKDAEAAKRLQEEKKVHEKVKSELLEKTFSEIKGKSVELTEKTNGKGVLFSQVNKKEIQDAIKNQLGLEINENSINLTSPIKEVGDYKIEIKKGDISTDIILKVLEA